MSLATSVAIFAVYNSILGSGVSIKRQPVTVRSDNAHLPPVPPIVCLQSLNSLQTYNLQNVHPPGRKQGVVQIYFEEYWGGGNVNIVDEVCTDNFVIDYPMHGPRRDKEAAKKMMLDLREVRKQHEPLRNRPNTCVSNRRSRTFLSTPTSSL